MTFPSVNKGELSELQRILDDDIQKLRKLASPSHHGSA